MTNEASEQIWSILERASHYLLDTELTLPNVMLQSVSCCISQFEGLSSRGRLHAQIQSTTASDNSIM